MESFVGVAIVVLVGVFLGFLVGFLCGGVKISIQQLPPKKEEDDIALPSFRVGSPEHLKYIADERRKAKGED